MVHASWCPYGLCSNLLTYWMFTFTTILFPGKPLPSQLEKASLPLDKRTLPGYVLTATHLVANHVLRRHDREWNLSLSMSTLASKRWSFYSNKQATFAISLGWIGDSFVHILGFLYHFHQCLQMPFSQWTRWTSIFFQTVHVFLGKDRMVYLPEI